MISKIYFPRLVLPTSAVIVALVDFFISSAILFGMMFWYGIWPGWHILALIPLTAVAFLASMGAGLWVAALNVEYRDFRYIVPFIVQFGLYVSPVGFSSSIVPENLRFWYSLNPMVGVIDGFRWAIAGAQTQIYWPGFALSLFVVFALLASGIWYFRRMERTFADVI
jgi:lipopolysaccharide transport system permease protein